MLAAYPWRVPVRRSIFSMASVTKNYPDGLREDYGYNLFSGS